MAARDKPLNVLIVSYNFPPEVNALAIRSFEHAREWIAENGKVEVLTDVPNFPEGIVYEGYKNRLRREQISGIDVVRVPQIISTNSGFLKRIGSFVSFMFSAILFSPWTRRKPDIVIASSPQFFAGFAGWIIAQMKRAKFILEIRDLWPESIAAVGAMDRGWLFRILEWVERFLYRRADHIVVVTNAFVHHIERSGIDKGKISVITNGVSVQEDMDRELDAEEEAVLASIAHLRSKFVVSYIGTLGMAHGLEVVVEAAARSSDPDVHFLVVGSGAERDRLHRMIEKKNLSNLTLLKKQTRNVVFQLFQITDASLVHLKDKAVFRTVIPSKMLEAMGLGIPVILGVKGESRDILLAAQAGIPMEPDDPDSLLGAIHELKSDTDKRNDMGAAGVTFVQEHFSRKTLAKRYWNLLERVSNKASIS